MFDSASDEQEKGGDKTLFKRLSDEVNADWAHFSEWRELASKAYDYMHGDQWTKEEKEVFKNNNREYYVFNRIASTIRFIAGEEIKNRREIKYHSRDVQNSGVTDVYSAGAEFFRDQNNGERLDSLALQDCLICGLGFIEDRVEFLDDPDGEVKLERLDPITEVIPARNSTEANLMDARRITRIKRITLEEAEELFPGFEPSQYDAHWFKGRGDDVEDDDEGGIRIDEDGNHDDEEYDPAKIVTIVEVQYWKREHMVRFQNLIGGGAILTMRKDAFEALSERLGAGGALGPSQKFMQKVYYRAFIGKSILEHERAPNQKCFTVKAITGYRNRNKKMWYGVINDMIDPQRFHNRILTTTDHIMKTNAKGGLIYQRNFTDDPEEFEEKFAAADTAIGVNALHDANGRPMVIPKPQTALPPAIQFLSGAVEMSFDQVTGLNAEAKGQSDHIIAASLSYSRRQTAMTVLQDIFDSFKNYRMLQGRSLLEWMRAFLADGRLVRVAGDGYERYLPLLKLESSAKFDTVIDDTPSNPDEKMRVWPVIEKLLALFGDQVDAQMIATIADYAPLPQSLIDKFKKALEAKKPNPEEAQFKAQAALQALQLTMAQQEAEVEKTKAEVLKLKAQARAELAKASEAGAPPQQVQTAEDRRKDIEVEIRRVETVARVENERLQTLKDLKAAIVGEERAMAEIDRIRAETAKIEMETALRPAADGARIELDARRLDMDGEERRESRAERQAARQEDREDRKRELAEAEHGEAR